VADYTKDLSKRSAVENVKGYRNNAGPGSYEVNKTPFDKTRDSSNSNHMFASRTKRSILSEKKAKKMMVNKLSSYYEGISKNGRSSSTLNQYKDVMQAAHSGGHILIDEGDNKNHSILK